MSRASVSNPACAAKQPPLPGPTGTEGPRRVTALQELQRVRRVRCGRLRQITRRRLRAALRDIAPAERVIVFGSLTKPGRFRETSDVALEGEPAGLSVYQLTSLLAEAVGRPVDVVLLPECRFRDKILRESERWTLPD